MSFVDPFDKFGVAPPLPLYMVDPDAKEPAPAVKKDDDDKEDLEAHESDGEYDDDETGITYFEEPVAIGRTLRKFVNNARCSDIRFIVGEEKQIFYGHKVILGSRSPYFRAMFFSHFVEATESELAIDESPTIFRAVLHCIYTDHCQLDASVVVETLVAAKKYQVRRLIRKCMKYMKSGITVENACELYETTLSINEEEASVLAYIEDNADECFMSESFLDLSPETVLKLVRSDFISIQEIDVFRAVLKWADWQLGKVGMSGGSAAVMGEARRGILREVLPHVRFPIMHLDEFNTAVPQSGILPAAELLPLYAILAKRDDGKATVMRESYHCGVCTYFNTGDRTQCQMCQTPAPPPGKTVRYVDWQCATCTYENRAARPKCEMCGGDRPEPRAEDMKAAAKKEAKVGDAKYLDEPRNPRRADVTRMRFLLCAADTDANAQDVRATIMLAYNGRAAYKASPHFTVDIHVFSPSNGAPTLAKLREYDAIYTWSASTQYPEPFCDTCADYIDGGGGVIVGAIATNTGTYGMAGRYERSLYSPTVRGAQISSPATLVLPTTPRERAHPVFRNVERFDGGVGSYRTGVRLTPSAVTLAAWTDGTPLVAEKEGPRRKGRPGLAMTLNFYPVSSAVNDQYWRRDSDGGLLLLNSLVYCAQKGGHVRPKLRVPRAAGGMAAAAANSPFF